MTRFPLPDDGGDEERGGAAAVAFEPLARVFRTVIDDYCIDQHVIVMTPARWERAPESRDPRYRVVTQPGVVMATYTEWSRGQAG